MSKPNVPDTDRLFDEIAGKLNELSGNKPNETPAERFEKLQAQLRRSQDDWKQAQSQMQERMQNFEQFSNSQNELSQEMRRAATLLEQERQNNSKTSSDLAKALELNLKLQFDIEEVRTKASQLVAEERKHNQFLVEKNRNLSTELELSQAMNQEVRMELGKAREKYLQDQNQWTEEKANLQQQLKQQMEEFEAANLKLDENEAQIRRKDLEIEARIQEVHRQAEDVRALMDTLKGFEEHANMQSDSMRQLTAHAERKLVELKLALDKKIIESNDYYSHLQQALTQVQILRQENAALKDYIQKLTHLHQTQHPNPVANPQHQYQPAPQVYAGQAPVPPPPVAVDAAIAKPVEPPTETVTTTQTQASAVPPQSPQAPTSFGSPMTVPSTPAFMASNTPAPIPAGSPIPAWVPAGPVQTSAANAPRTRPPFPAKSASGH